MHRKQKKLTDFTVKSTERSVENRATDIQKEAELVSKPVPGQVESTGSAPGAGFDRILEEIKELIIKRTIQHPDERGEPGERATSTHEKKDSEFKEQTTPDQDFKYTFAESTLNQITIDAYSRKGILLVQCDKRGECEDGVKVGEVFSDSRGVRWQRTFIETTRLPIYLNFIVEEALIKGKVGKAFNIVTSRGARALIPEDYICEAISRYGLDIKIEKCRNYKILPWSERTSKKGG